MANHPNRGARSASSNPPPEQILAARTAAGLTQTQAAELVHATCRRWQEWEAGDYRMHPGLFELFQLKTRQAKLPKAGRAAAPALALSEPMSRVALELVATSYSEGQLPDVSELDELLAWISGAYPPLRALREFSHLPWPDSAA